MRTTLLIFCLLALAGCDDGGGCPQPHQTDTSGGDILPGDTHSDGMLPLDGLDDGTGPEDIGDDNTPPTLGPLPPVALDMGSTTTLGLAALMSDLEDPDGALSLTWSADHVALQDGPGHALLVVAPVNWWGIETILLTLTDAGGLTAGAELVVTVHEVIPPVEVPPETCGEVLFSYVAPGAQVVELAGTFNDWTPELMDDADGDGTWERLLVLTPGAWEYKFVEDGDWTTDPTNPNKVSDGYGEHNSLLEVPPCPPE